MNELEERIRKGLTYFRDIKPSKWNPGHTAHLHVFLELVERYVNSVNSKKIETEEDFNQAVQEIFNENEK